MIARYARPEIGRMWSDDAQLETWRQVEVATCEEMEGPTDDELGAMHSACTTVEAVQERKRVTGHVMAAFLDRIATSAGMRAGGSAAA